LAPEGNATFTLRGVTIGINFHWERKEDQTFEGSLRLLLNPDGKITAIATTGSVRSLSLPDVPTVQEGGLSGYDVTSWNGLAAPTKTPGEIVIRFENKIDLHKN